MDFLTVDPPSSGASASRGSMDSGYNTVAHPTPYRDNSSLPPAEGAILGDDGDRSPRKAQRRDTPAQGSVLEPVVTTPLPAVTSGVVHLEPVQMNAQLDAEPLNAHIEELPSSSDGSAPSQSDDATPKQAPVQPEKRMCSVDSTSVFNEEQVRELSRLRRENEVLQAARFGHAEPQPVDPSDALSPDMPTFSQVPTAEMPSPSDATQQLSTPRPDEIPPAPHMGYYYVSAPRMAPLSPQAPPMHVQNPPPEQGPFMVPNPCYMPMTTRITSEQATMLVQARMAQRIADLPPLPEREEPSEHPHGLTEDEIWWRDHSQLVETLGFRMRPRYKPDWQPDEEDEPRPWWKLKASSKVREDYLQQPHPDYMDARRIDDNYAVMIKRIDPHKNPAEINSTTALSGWTNACDPHNKCVLVHAVNMHREDRHKLMIMPRLRPWDNPGFDTMGEAVGFFKQIIEGLFYFHKKNITLRNVCKENIMMDPRPMYTKSFHSIQTDRTPDLKHRAPYMTRTDRPPKYYFVNLSQAIVFASDIDQSNPVRMPISFGKDKTVPEHRGDIMMQTTHCDPFAVDVYCLGNIIRTEFLQARKGFGFMKHLVDAMTHELPHKRPKMPQVLLEFQQLQEGLTKGFLRGRCVVRKDSIFKQAGKLAYHWRHKVFYKAMDIPAIPIPYY